MPVTAMRHARIDAGVILFVLSQRTAISTGRLSLIERNLVVPSAEERQRIAEVLGKPEAAVFPSSVAPFEPPP